MRSWLKSGVTGLTLAAMLGAPGACSSESDGNGGATASSSQPGDGNDSSGDSAEDPVNSNQASSTSEDEALGFSDIASMEGDAGIGMLGDAESCAGEARAAENIALDIHLMVDISGSMTDILPGGGTETKWDAVNAALQQFVQSPETEDIGIGISYFPLLKDGVPDICTESNECGDGGPCSNSWCVVPADLDDGSAIWAVPLLPQPILCNEDADCGDDGVACETVRGYCVEPPNPPDFSGDLAIVGQLDDGTYVGTACSTDEQCPLGADGDPLPCEALGVCTNSLAEGELVSCTESLACPDGGPCDPIPDVCAGRAICDVNTYVPPAVPIRLDADRSDAIVDSLDSQQLASTTPTAPALEGALIHSQDWAEQNPSHQVVTVLATDGFPTTCSPLEIEDIAELASDAVASTPSIKTFVIGVFGQADLGAEGAARLDTVAVAGGTENAFIVNTSGDVSQEFLDALNRIRDTSISCEFQLPDMDNLDLDRVNLNVMDVDGNETQLINVGDELGCAEDNDGWYYVLDNEGVPVEINVCPNICDVFTSGGVSAELEIGCETQTLLR